MNAEQAKQYAREQWAAHYSVNKPAADLVQDIAAHVAEQCGAKEAELSILDKFAMAALPGILGSRTGFLVDCGTDNAPGWAYSVAEAMLKERARRAEEAPDAR